MCAVALRNRVCMAVGPRRSCSSLRYLVNMSFVSDLASVCGEFLPASSTINANGLSRTSNFPASIALARNWSEHEFKRCMFLKKMMQKVLNHHHGFSVDVTAPLRTLGSVWRRKNGQIGAAKVVVFCAAENLPEAGRESRQGRSDQAGGACSCDPSNTKRRADTSPAPQNTPFKQTQKKKITLQRRTFLWNSPLLIECFYIVKSWSLLSGSLLCSSTNPTISCKIVSHLKGSSSSCGIIYM